MAALAGTEEEEGLARVFKRTLTEPEEEKEDLVLAFKRARRTVQEARAARKRAASSEREEQQPRRRRPCRRDEAELEELVEAAVARRLEEACATTLETEVVRERIERKVEQRLDEVQAALALETQAGRAAERRHAEELAAKDRELEEQSAAHGRAIKWLQRQHQEEYERVLRLWQESEKQLSVAFLLPRCGLGQLIPRCGFGLA
jgi:hypothetical protein